VLAHFPRSERLPALRARPENLGSPATFRAAELAGGGVDGLGRRRQDGGYLAVVGERSEVGLLHG